MANTMDGTITIVQEGRFQMTDDSGTGHLFILSPYAAAETEQLRSLKGDGIRVRVSYSEPKNVIGNVATNIVRIG